MNFIAKKEDGFSLMELLIVICVMAILFAIAGIFYSGWMDRYNVEREIREMHGDLLNARARAAARSRFHFVTLAANQYTINEDINPWPDGDGQLNAAGLSDSMRPGGNVYKDPIPLIRKGLNAKYPITWSNAGTTQINFNTRGIWDTTQFDTGSSAKVICSSAGINADNDCIVIAPTRIDLGRLTTTIPGGTCDATNCVAK